MLCKVEGSPDFITYDAVPDKSKITEIQFDGLTTERVNRLKSCDTVLSKVDWSLLINLEKITVKNSHFAGFLLDSKVKLPKLQLLEFDNTTLGIPLVRQLLKCSSNIHEVKWTSCKYDQSEHTPDEFKTQEAALKQEVEIINSNSGTTDVADYSEDFDEDDPRNNQAIEEEEGENNLRRLREYYALRQDPSSVSDEDEEYSQFSNDERLDLEFPDSPGLQSNGSMTISETDFDVHRGGPKIDLSRRRRSSSVSTAVEDNQRLVVPKGITIFCKKIGDGEDEFLEAYTSDTPQDQLPLKSEIITMEIIGAGADQTNIITEIDWSGLDNLEELQISEASIAAHGLEVFASDQNALDSTFAKRPQLEKLKKLTIEKTCAVDAAGLSALNYNNYLNYLDLKEGVRIAVPNSRDESLSLYAYSDQRIRAERDKVNDYVARLNNTRTEIDTEDFEEDQEDDMVSLPAFSPSNSLWIDTSIPRETPTGSRRGNFSPASSGSNLSNKRGSSHAGEFEDDFSDSPIRTGAKAQRNIRCVLINNGRSYIRNYDDLSVEDRAQIKGIEIVGRTTDYHLLADPSIDLTKLPNLQTVSIENATIKGEIKKTRWYQEEDGSLPELRRLYLHSCNVEMQTLSDLTAEADRLSTFRYNDILNAQGEGFTEGEIEILEKLDWSINSSDVPTFSDTSVSTFADVPSAKTLRDYYVSPSVASKPQELFTSQHVDKERQREITCFVESGESVSYTELTAEQRERVVTLIIEGQEDNQDYDVLADEDIDFGTLPNLRTLSIRNATIKGDISTQAESGVLFPHLETLNLEDCKVDVSVLTKLRAEAGGLLRFDYTNIMSSRGAPLFKFEERKVKRLVPSEPYSSIDDFSEEPRTQQPPLPYAYQDLSEFRRNINEQRGRSHVYDEFRMRTSGVDTKAPRKQHGLGSHFFSPTSGDKARAPVLSRRTNDIENPSLLYRGKVVDSLYTSSEEKPRTLEEIKKRLDQGLETIRQDVKADLPYKSVVEKANSVVHLNYQPRKGTPITVLDAAPDKVTVYKNWMQTVDPKNKILSLEQKALLVLDSLGIPPCPPTIHVERKGKDSDLADAVEIVFKLLLDKQNAEQDQAEIEVSINPLSKK